MKLSGITEILHLKRTESTQTLAKLMAEEGAPDHALVWADSQSRGRGRLSRRWESPEGGLYFSLILRPEFPPSRLPEISLLTARAVASALAELSALEIFIKPPNDVLAGRPGAKPQKVCGILAEASGNSRGLDWLVLGIGINVNNSPKLKKAASLKQLSARQYDLEEVLRRFLLKFDELYQPMVMARPSPQARSSPPFSGTRS